MARRYKSGSIGLEMRRHWVSDLRLWWLYLIECEGGSLYTGIALDVEARYAQHLAGKGAKYTRANRPVRLIGKLPYADRGAATRAEHAFKRLTRQEKRQRIPEFESAESGGIAPRIPAPVAKPAASR